MPKVGAEFEFDADGAVEFEGDDFDFRAEGDAQAAGQSASREEDAASDDSQATPLGSAPGLDELDQGVLMHMCCCCGTHAVANQT